MSVKWTAEQERAITLRDHNILVSAAAGSGKTAVLVERILSRITDPEKPVDIDRLLVVTFTRAAAAEMRTRIGSGIEKRLAEDPENEHLQRQSILLHHAQICTIDSFCTFVIQNYFHRIALDPRERIASEGELKLLRSEVMEELLEAEYTRAATGENEAFLHLTEALSPGRNDRAIEEMIFKIADYAQSDPDPAGWLHRSEALVSVDTEEELEATPWAQQILEDTKTRLHNLRAMTEQIIAQAIAPGGPAAYVPMLKKDIALLDALLSCESFRDFREQFAEIKFATLSSKKSEGEDEAARERAKEARKMVKDAIDDLRKEFFLQPPEEILAQLHLARPLTTELVRLASAFLDRFAAEKRERGICDFSDLEHNALAILLEKTEAGYVRTEAARELAEQYEEILIDEYQDSNALQEVILEAVSRTADGGANRFLVGDIKQSIYGFRMARPELFLEKYARYAAGEENGERIDLSKNFRSRTEVLDCVNAIFEKLMAKDLGGIVYDDAARLYYGAEYPASEPADFARAELLLVDEPSYEFALDNPKEAIVQTEALAVASRIRALVETGRVYDAKANATRPVRYSDCVVLLRSMSDVYVRILQEAGVPAHAESREGYFSAYEVATVLNYLRICDNPRQDIPLAAVLRSPIGGLSDVELAELRSAHPKGLLWEAAEAVATENKKLHAFLEQLHTFRDLAAELPVHELILRVLQDTGFGLFAAAMPAGEQREANLRMLVQRAVEFESTSYHGLFRFIRYMEDLEKYRVDFGEVSVFGEGENAVRVMTIHKSKGLQFPIVFVSNLGHGFNFGDSRGPIAMHARLGLAVDAVDLEHRVRSTTLVKAAVQKQIKEDMLAEELRVLYVAMTRAQEKLILTGAVKDLEKAMQKAEAGVNRETLLGATCYLDWILAAISGGAPIRVEPVDPQMLFLAGHTEEERRASFADFLADPSIPDDAAVREQLAGQAAFRYPYAYLEKMPAKVTVTELKRASLANLEEEAGGAIVPELPIVPYVPRFLREDEEASGAARGTIYHRVWECIDYTGEPDMDGVQEQLAAMVTAGKLGGAEATLVKPADVLTFLQCPLGQRMRAAALAGKLRREQPFVFHIPAREVDAELPEEERILVQGVIDAYFEEDGKYILVDYKTDRVHSADGAELVERYAVQLRIYARALAQITGREVAEAYLYSTSLGRSIAVPLEPAGLKN